MSDLTIIVTDAGRAALVNAANTGTAPVTIVSCGVSATALVPSPAATVLPGEIKRIGALSGDVVDDETIHLIIRDESAGQYTLRSFGLYLQDGTLFAIYGQPAPIIEKSAQSLLLLAVDLRFADIDAAALTFGDANFLNPPATTEIIGVVELATDAEAITGTDPARAVTPRGMKAAVMSWINDRFGEGAPSAFVKSLLNAANAAALRLSLGLKSASLKDEGAGNGLNADLLDGEHGAYYSNITARLGYTPWHPSNDGAGSGLDADLLDGRHASGFLNLGAGGRPFDYDYAGGGSYIRGDTGGWAVGYFFRNYLDVGVGGFGAYGAGAALAYHFIGDSHGSTTNLRVYASGNVGIGGGASQKLEVHGNARINGELIVGSGATIAGSTAWHAGNDGAGSGMDADLLDGQQGSYYTDIAGRLGFTPIRQGGGAGQLSNQISIGWNGFRLKAQVDSADLGNIVFDNQISDVWRVSNDGAGSGLDADLLDGLHASHFLPAASYTASDVLAKIQSVDGAGSNLDADFLDGHQASAFAMISAFIGANQQLSDSGHQRIPGGLMLQWGLFNGPINASMSITFPQAFGTFALPLLSGEEGTLGDSSASENGAWITGRSLTGFTVYSPQNSTRQNYWFAIGA